MSQDLWVIEYLVIELGSEWQPDGETYTDEFSALEAADRLTDCWLNRLRALVRGRSTIYRARLYAPKNGDMVSDA